MSWTRSKSSPPPSLQTRSLHTCAKTRHHGEKMIDGVAGNGKTAPSHTSTNTAGHRHGCCELRAGLRL
jgi:hypothetical protein